MRRTSLAAAAIVVLTATIVPATSAVATPATTAAAVAATPAPLLYTTSTAGADGGHTDAVRSVRYDATVRRLVAAATLTVEPRPGGDGSDISGGEIVGPAASYSPDRSRVVWIQATYTPTSAAYAVKVKTLATNAVATFPFPAGAGTETSGAYPDWFPGGTELAMVLTRDSASSVVTLDLTTGTYAWRYQLAPGTSARSLVVSPDGTIAFVSTAGVAVLTGTTPSTARFLRRTGANEYCETVRARPGTQREFSYLCTTYGTGVPTRQVLRSQTAAGPVRTIYTTPTGTFVDAFRWSPSGTALALKTTAVREVNPDRCVNAMTTSVSTLAADGTRATTLQTEPTITAQTCRGESFGDVDTVVWSSDARTVAFLHAPRFLGTVVAYAVDASLPSTQQQVELARGVIGLDA